MSTTATEVTREEMGRVRRETGGIRRGPTAASRVVGLEARPSDLVAPVPDLTPAMRQAFGEPAEDVERWDGLS